ncbi:translation initiation factor IF-2 [Sedimentibacter sp. zth1]|uniref:translation initiation factor IF-2 n=1 Tax=Sedimentibacter sp. zth1 TaxID=2816908 RepID=UPI001A92F802|nr:translation initiation factor IF-2 [Sedimentibacter sp. zth1]QSX06545.1 translation initiation factor IF-2 [Sedimentibacter sp. zth1]
MRIYELAKELKINSKELIDIIEKEFNIEVNSHMSSISDLETLRIRKIIDVRNGNKKEENAKPKVKEAKTKIKDKKETSSLKADVLSEKTSAIDEKKDISLNDVKVKKVNKEITNKKVEVKSKNTSAKNHPNNNNNNNKNNNNNRNNKNNKSNRNNKNNKNNKNNNKNLSEANKPKEKAPEQPKIKRIEMEDEIVVRDLADKMGVPVSKVISKLIMLGLMVNMNQEIDFDTASLIATDFNAEVYQKVVIDELQVIEEKLDQDVEDDPKDLKERPPIVTVMGHVDHGKTSLLDAIRDTVETSHEAGGITQHIGASIVEINGKKITFLDTPGHEAFTAMRARGASITDMAILVVAADDGVKPQTIEAINHAKAANIPLIVAVNKMDRPTANIDKVKQELTEQGVLAEDWGGDTIFVPVSAKKREGIQELLEMILLVSEMQELKANPNRNARGTIVEAKLDKGRGPVATVLVQKGTLHKGDFVLVGASYGKVRALFNSVGKKINQAGPSIPVEVLGLSETPQAGDILIAMNSEKDAKVIAEKRKDKVRTDNMNATAKVSLDDLYDKIQMGEVKDLNIILKADVRGSIEAIKQSLEKLSIKEVKVKIIHNGVGGINENDINLASASNAIVIGFNVRPSVFASELAKREKVDVRTYNIIYNAIEDIQSAIKGMLDPEYKEVVQGRAEVRATFKVPNIGIIAGVYILNGKVTRKSKVRLLRNDIVIHEGDVSSLKRFKDDASELNTSYEGGLGIDKYNDIKIGDIIEAYIMEEIKR